MKITLTTPSGSETFENKSMEAALNQAQDWLDSQRSVSETKIDIFDEKNFLGIASKTKILKAVFDASEMSLRELLKRISERRFGPGQFEA